MSDAAAPMRPSNRAVPADSLPHASARLPTRAVRAPDLPPVASGALEPAVRDAVSELLITLADDEFVLGFWDSEWTGIAPMLEEDVALSSLAQDELGHARLFFELAAALRGGDADVLAFGRRPDEYRHCRLLDHPRTDWAFSIVRRWLYDTADAARLDALATSAFTPLAEVTAKIRREERYHLLHVDAWMRRLAGGGSDARNRLETSLGILWPEALGVFAPLDGERLLVDERILAAPMEHLAATHLTFLHRRLGELGIVRPGPDPSPNGGRTRSDPSASFSWLWEQFTSVSRLEAGAAW